jgi:lysine 2,3-aminomutase
MAGITKQGIFSEKISPYLARKLEALKKTKGENSGEYQGLALQYVLSEKEYAKTDERNVRHWEADLAEGPEAHALPGMERLYRQSLVIEPTLICAAHCRYCLRGNYDIFTLTEDQLLGVAKYCGSEAVRSDLEEVLVTGGDPLIVPQRLNFLVESLIEYAPNVKIIRIGTRLPQQDPDRIDNNVTEIFRRHGADVRFEIATQINHPVELSPEVRDIFRTFRGLGAVLYSQNVLLKGVNDSIGTLVELYQAMRELGIEAHYLFHCVPMRGIHHLRTSVDKGLRLARELVNSGEISGRVKPMLAAMTDVGKVTFYEGVILGKEPSGHLLLQTQYRYQDRLRWNPGWKLPGTAEVDSSGLIRVRYLDGEDR